MEFEHTCTLVVLIVSEIFEYQIKRALGTTLQPRIFMLFISKFNCWDMLITKPAEYQLENLYYNEVSVKLINKPETDINPDKDQPEAINTKTEDDILISHQKQINALIQVQQLIVILTVDYQIY
ncbi:Hypothetical_protein [Hexamita inflata]|uniref:Hypothetical_protein n=1 Tax=Hexamita inflata TaxID=28002 RepID=A0AA86PDJ3_9EUKA|nr:Hypothetical protein HINF_LOCUS24266 [Hexamita inflata]CAI9936623.1 Hypothetical protein HINF_LOCUS24268 [Hexamita inflata]